MTQTKADIRREIISAMLEKHAVTAEEFFGRSRDEDVIGARRDAAKQLRAAKFSVAAIGRILKRSRSAVDHYIYDYAPKKKDRARVSGALKKVPRDVADLVGAIADAEGVSPVMLIAQWVSERAEYEASAKAKEAA